MSSIKPTITAEDILAVKAPKTSGILPDGIYEMEIASVKDREGTANIVLRKSEKTGNRYLNIGMKAPATAAHSAYVWANFVMVDGDSAKFGKNLAGFYAALGLTEVPTIEATGTKTDKNGKEETLVSFFSSDGELAVAGRTIKVRLGTEEDNAGKPRQKVVSFIKAE